MRSKTKNHNKSIKKKSSIKKKIFRKSQNKSKSKKHNQKGGNLYGANNFNSETKVDPPPPSPFGDIKCTIL